MTFHQLECFIQVAEQLSFVGAAKKLFTTQPAITYQIHSLEKELNTQLFHRTNRTVSLTETGRALYQSASQIWDMYQDALLQIEDIEHRNRSYVVIGVRKLFDYSILSNFVKQYNILRPDVKVDVIPQSDTHPPEYLYNGRTHLSFLLDTECAGNPDIGFFPIYEMKHYALLNEDHPLAHKPLLTLADLQGQKVILPEDEYSREAHVPSVSDLEEAGADLSLSSPSFEGSMIMVQAELGIMFLNSTAERKFPHMVKVPFDVPPVHIGIAWLKKDISPEAQSFLNLVMKDYHRDTL